MARTYAGVLGLLAFAVVMFRSVVNDGPMAATVGQAIVSMLAFTLVGLLLGRVGQFVVDDGVRGELALAMQESSTEKRRGAVGSPANRESEPATVKQPS